MARTPILSLLVILCLCQTISSASEDGYILTVPKVLREGFPSELCLTSFSQDVREVKIDFIKPKEGNVELQLKDNYVPGDQQCTKFSPPAMGMYQLLVTDEVNILHDMVEVHVERPAPVTLCQTDKPQYKPGDTVKFRVLTLLPDLKPRAGKISYIYIKDPNDIRVKQFLNPDTDGIVSLEFELSSMAKLGTWKIDIVVDSDSNERPMSTTFKVMEYVLPRFEVKINPPSYILSDTEVIEGNVCAKYTYGKNVVGYLELNLCWGYYSPDTRGCQRYLVEMDGCHQFSANMTELMEGSNSYRMWGARLQVTASVTERDTGVKVNATHSGPGITYSPLKISINTDYTNTFFKPRLPYVGKVSVETPDGKAAPGEDIYVRAVDDKNQNFFSGNFTTDASGQVQFSLCGEFTEETTAINIEAIATKYGNSDAFDASPQPFYGSRRTSTFRHLQQWFSPSFSYIQIPHIEGSSLQCGERISLDIPYTTRADTRTTFTYQIIKNGALVKTGQVTASSDSKYTSKDTEAECLQRMEVPLTPSVPPTDDLPVYYDVDEAPPPPPEVTEDEDYEETTGDPLEPPPPPPITPRPFRPREVIEPVVRAEQVSDQVANLHLELEISAAMAPGFRLLVFHVLEATGEVVADSREFQVTPCFDNKVSMKFNTTEALPGEGVSVSVSAAPGSVCGVGVVDKSVNILGGNHQITQETVFKLLENANYLTNRLAYPRVYHHRDNYCENRIKEYLESGTDKVVVDDIPYWHYASDYVDAKQAFNNADLHVLTNLDLETRPCKRLMPYVYAISARRGGDGPVPARFDDSIVYDSEVVDQNVAPSGGNVKLRTEFPETWLWDIVIVQSTGMSKLPLTAPHTVTSWVGNALCVDAGQGFGVSPMTSLTTFQPFFLSVHLPYSAVRGERLPVIVTVFNYLDKCLNVKISLLTDNSLDVSRPNDEAQCVCGGKSSSLRFYVTPLAIGDLSLTATAVVVAGKCGNEVTTETGYEGYSDGVKRELLVKAEGVIQQYTYSMYMCPTEEGAATEDVKLELPEDIVEESSFGQIRVIGDIMGPALSNLDNLVRMPTGCGEQNMVGFVPNILVLKYLTNTNRLTREIEEKTKKHMEIGYQRELNYRHTDGSFSAFGQQGDNVGSVWLTAFVVKSFAQASHYVFIDREDMEKSIAFLRRSQLETGCFRETGKVFSSYMMGGLAKGKKKDDQTALTAYVLVALLHADVDKEEEVIKLAVECLQTKTKKLQKKMDPYTLALYTYAQTILEPTGRNTASVLKILAKKAKKEGEYQYWQREITKPKPTNTWYYYAAPSAEVEMTSYALMAYINFYGRKVVEDHHGIAMWISQQRNPYGGFASTQDTIVGLNALSEFAELAYNSEATELAVDISSDKGISQTVKVSERANTTLLLQSNTIPSLPDTLSVTTTGTGCALVQAFVQYNKMPEKIVTEGQKPSFQLRVKAKPYKHDIDRCDRRTLEISVGSRGSKFAKGMTLVTVQMITGWSPAEDSLLEIQSLYPELGIQRHEYNEQEGSLTLYFDELSKKMKMFRVHVEQDKDLVVSAPKPANVKVFQYYESDVSLIRPYTLKTTCGTKLSIPRNITPIPGIPMQVRVNSGRMAAAFEDTGSKCPWCPSRKGSPTNLEEIFCKSNAIYKAIAGRKGKFPTKLKVDVRPSKKVKVNKFVSHRLPAGCTCSNLESPKKRVFIFVEQPVESKTMSLDATASVMLASKDLEKEMRKLQKKCKLEE